MNSTAFPPCNRGIPGNPAPSWHHFEASGPAGTGHIVCRYCGQRPDSRPVNLDHLRERPALSVESAVQ